MSIRSVSISESDSESETESTTGSGSSSTYSTDDSYSDESESSEEEESFIPFTDESEREKAEITKEIDKEYLKQVEKLESKRDFIVGLTGMQRHRQFVWDLLDFIEEESKQLKKRISVDFPFRLKFGKRETRNSTSRIRCIKLIRSINKLLQEMKSFQMNYEEHRKESRVAKTNQIGKLKKKRNSSNSTNNSSSFSSSESTESSIESYTKLPVSKLYLEGYEKFYWNWSEIGDDLMRIIVRFLEKDDGNWLNLMLTNKKWNKIVHDVLDINENWYGEPPFSFALRNRMIGSVNHLLKFENLKLDTKYYRRWTKPFPMLLHDSKWDEETSIDLFFQHPKFNLESCTRTVRYCPHSASPIVYCKSLIGFENLPKSKGFTVKPLIIKKAPIDLFAKVVNLRKPLWPGLAPMSSQLSHQQFDIFFTAKWAPELKDKGKISKVVTFLGSRDCNHLNFERMLKTLRESDHSEIISVLVQEFLLFATIAKLDTFDDHWKRNNPQFNIPELKDGDFWDRVFKSHPGRIPVITRMLLNYTDIGMPSESQMNRVKGRELKAFKIGIKKTEKRKKQCIIQ